MSGRVWPTALREGELIHVHVDVVVHTTRWFMTLNCMFTGTDAPDQCDQDWRPTSVDDEVGVMSADVTFPMIRAAGTIDIMGLGLWNDCVYQPAVNSYYCDNRPLYGYARVPMTLVR
jgi:hypothetical protein